MITFSIEKVTPAWASKVLAESNEHNRNISMPRARTYAEAMKKGEFKCLDPIAFTSNGMLKNGQHRLSAVVLDNVSVDMVIARGVDDDTTFDKGYVRTTADALLMRGLLPENLATKDITATARCFINWTENGYTSRRTILDEEIGRFVTENQDNLLKANAIGANRKICKSLGVRVALFGALNHGISEETLTRFCAVANSGFASDPSESAAIVLRNYLISKKNEHGWAIVERCRFAENAIRDFANHTPRRKAYTNPKHIYVIKEEENA